MRGKDVEPAKSPSRAQCHLNSGSSERPTGFRSGASASASVDAELVEVVEMVGVEEEESSRTESSNG